MGILFLVLSPVGFLKTCVLPLQIIFEAIRGVSIRSDTAIDDIVFQAGPCLGKV